MLYHLFSVSPHFLSDRARSCLIARIFFCVCVPRDPGFPSVFLSMRFHSSELQTMTQVSVTDSLYVDGSSQTSVFHGVSSHRLQCVVEVVSVLRLVSA